MRRSTLPEPAAAAATKAELQRLRALVRERDARDAEGVFVCEGPRVIAAALDHGAELLECFVGDGASTEIEAVARRCAGAGVTLHRLDAAAVARIGDTKTPQPLFAVARRPRRGLEALAGAGLAIVVVAVNDPGNAGTLLRSAAAAGVEVLVLGPGSVDAYNPKVVRASAGACFAVGIVEGVPAVDILEALGADGVHRLGAVAHGGAAPERVDLGQRIAFVLGHETRGLDPGLPLDGYVTIPMHAGESINLAMAGTVLAFEAARQRRAR